MTWQIIITYSGQFHMSHDLGTVTDDDKLYLTTLTLSAEAGFHNGRVKKTLTNCYK
jgi:hypothetical protein